MDSRINMFNAEAEIKELNKFKMIPMRSDIDGLIKNLQKTFEIKTGNQQFIMDCVFEELNLLKEEINKLKEENKEYKKDGCRFFASTQENKEIEKCVGRSVDRMIEEKNKLKEENKEIKEEMKTMYKIIMNDGSKYELSNEQSTLKMVQSNISLMLEKFKMMSVRIAEEEEFNKGRAEVFKLFNETENKLKKEINELKEENKMIKIGTMSLVSDLEAKIKEKEKNEKESNEYKVDSIMKDNIIKNMLFTIISNDKDGDLEYKIKNDYTVAGIEIYNENVHKYYKKVVKEMNDTDWNEDNYMISLEYDNNYTFNSVFKDEEQE